MNGPEPVGAVETIISKIRLKDDKRGQNGLVGKLSSDLGAAVQAGRLDPDAAKKKLVEQIRAAGIVERHGADVIDQALGAFETGRLSRRGGMVATRTEAPLPGRPTTSDDVPPEPAYLHDGHGPARAFSNVSTFRRPLETVASGFRLAGLTAERAIVGVVMLDGMTEPIKNTMSALGLRDDRLSLVWRAALDLHADGLAVDLNTVRIRLEERGQVEACGGYPFLLGLLEGVSHTTNFSHYMAQLARIRTHELDLRHAELLGAAIQEGAEELEIEALKRTYSEQTERLNRIRSGGEMHVAQFAPLDLALASDPAAQEVRWVVDTIVPRGGQSLLAADAKVGKTWLAYRLALGCVFEDFAIGTFKVCQPCRVLIVQMEMPEDITLRRLTKIAKGMGLDPERLAEAQAEDRIRVLSRPPLDLTKAGDVEAFNKYVLDFKPDLLILDSMMQAFAALGDGLYNAGVVRQALTCFRPLEDAGIGLLILTHNRKSSSNGKPDNPLSAMIGSQAFAAVARSLYSLSRLPSEAGDPPGRFGLVLSDTGGWDLHGGNATFSVQDSDGGASTLVEIVKPTGKRSNLTTEEVAAVAIARLVRLRFSIGRQDALTLVEKETHLSERTVTRGLTLALERKYVRSEKVPGTRHNEKVLAPGENGDFDA